MNGAVRVLIAEDDAVQASRLARMVEELEPEWMVSPVARDWPSLMSKVEEADPHVLLLDIHMPGKEREASLDELKSMSCRPAIIVTTGDPTFALDAFDVDATDYLIKPFGLGRLALAFAKAKRTIDKSSGASQAAASAVGDRWIMAARGNDSVIVRLEDIVFLQADRKYTRLITKDFEAIVRMGISDVEKLLEASVFVRVHRSTIVNVRHVQLVRRDEMGRLRIHLVTRPEKLIVSRPFEAQFRAL